MMSKSKATNVYQQILSISPRKTDTYSFLPRPPNTESRQCTTSMSRHDSIARSIVSAIRNGRRNRSRSVLSLIFAILSSIFSFFQLNLQKIRPLYFANLRRNHWDVDDDAYIESFRSRDSLKSIGDMGFSGSVCSP